MCFYFFNLSKIENIREIALIKPGDLLRIPELYDSTSSIFMNNLCKTRQMFGSKGKKVSPEKIIEEYNVI